MIKANVIFKNVGGDMIDKQFKSLLSIEDSLNKEDIESIEIKKLYSVDKNLIEVYKYNEEGTLYLSNERMEYFGRKKLGELIDNMKTAHNELLEFITHTDNVSDRITDMFSCDYPYEKSFDEINITEWGNIKDGEV